MSAVKWKAFVFCIFLIFNPGAKACVQNIHIQPGSERRIAISMDDSNGQLMDGIDPTGYIVAPSASLHNDDSGDDVKNGPPGDPCKGQPCQAGGNSGGGSDPRIASVISSLKRLSKELDSHCLKFLKSKGQDPIAYLNSLINFADAPGVLAVKDMPGTIAQKDGISSLKMANAVTGHDNTVLTVNGLGAFFNSSYMGIALTTDRGRIKGGATAAQDFILLHELGHGMDAIAPDGFDQSKADANNKTLEKECKDTIESFEKGS